GVTVGTDNEIWFTELQRIGTNSTSLVYGILGHASLAGQITEVLIGAWAQDIQAGPNGDFWVPDWTELGGDAIVRVTKSGNETRFPIPGGLNAPGDVGPSDLAVASDGTVWFTQARVPNVGRITPSGRIDNFTVGGASRDIAIGSDGNIWF